MESKYKTAIWLIKSFSLFSIIKIFYYQYLKQKKKLKYKKKFSVKFRHRGETIKFILRQNNDDFAILRGTFMNKVYELDKKDIKIIFDCGSHIGCTSIYYAKRYPHAEVFCFEPDNDSRLMSLENARLNKVDLKIFDFGISDKGGIATFNRNLENPSYSYIGKGGKQKIRVKSIDEIIDFFNLKNIDLLKLDIEGSEPQAFKGMKRNIKKIKYILAENHFKFYSLKEIKEIFKKGGYTILEEPKIWKEVYGKENSMFLLKRK